MRVALDTCIGKRGEKLIRDSGHEVVAVAEEAEPDQSWFNKALAKDVEVIIACDADLEILCYDNKIRFFKKREDESGVDVAKRFILNILNVRRMKP